MLWKNLNVVESRVDCSSVIVLHDRGHANQKTCDVVRYLTAKRERERERESDRQTETHRVSSLGM